MANADKRPATVYTVGVTGDKSDSSCCATWLNHLPRSIGVNDVTFKFVQGGGVTVTPFEECGYISDHDFMVVCDTTDTVVKEAQMLMGNRCIEVSRTYKFEYMTNLFLAAKKSSLPLEVMLPVAWNSSCGIQQDGRVEFPKWCDRIICKPMGGARGNDQCIVSVELFEAFIKEQHKIPTEELETKFPTVKFFWSKTHKKPNGEFKEGMFGFFECAWMALPYVPNVYLEFRMIIGGDRFVVYKRNLTTINGESRVETSDTAPLTTENYPDYIADRNELSKKYNIDFSELLRFAHEAGITTGSIDFYLRTDVITGANVLGVFECCSQYGTAYVPLHTRKLLTHGFAIYCAKKFYATLPKD